MSDAVPAWAYERAEICPYDPRWADRARTERERLTGLLAPWLAGGVEHAGSTAVPGLAAKPIIDLMAPVSDLDVTAELVGTAPPLAMYRARISLAGTCVAEAAISTYGRAAPKPS